MPEGRLWVPTHGKAKDGSDFTPDDAPIPAPGPSPCVEEEPLLLICPLTCAPCKTYMFITYDFLLLYGDEGTPVQLTNQRYDPYEPPPPDEPSCDWYPLWMEATCQDGDDWYISTMASFISCLGDSWDAYITTFGEHHETHQEICAWARYRHPAYDDCPADIPWLTIVEAGGDELDWPGELPIEGSW
jgi:hypothetical protein